jgi:hypothetical protein
MRYPFWVLRGACPEPSVPPELESFIWMPCTSSILFSDNSVKLKEVNNISVSKRKSGKWNDSRFG